MRGYAGDNNKVRFSIVNDSPDAVSLLWVPEEDQDEEVIVIKKLLPGTSKVINTYLGHQFKVVDFEAPLVKIGDITIVSQLLTHKYVIVNGLLSPVVAQTTRRLRTVHSFVNIPTPNEHDESVQLG